MLLLLLANLDFAGGSAEAVTVEQDVAGRARRKHLELQDEELILMIVAGLTE